jgi:hypothetical protein
MEQHILCEILLQNCDQETYSLLKVAFGNEALHM